MRRRVRHLWEVVSHADTLKSVLEWFSLWKLVVSLVLGGITAIWGFLSHLPGPHIFVLVLGALAFGVTLVNAITWRSDHNRLRGAIQGTSATTQQELPAQTNFTTDSAVLSGPYIRSHTLRIADLAREDNLIRGRTFEDCTIHGPAVLALINHVQLLGAEIRSHPDVFFIELPESRYVVGPIGLENCVFKNCTFIRIGIMAKSDEIREWKKQIRVR